MDFMFMQAENPGAAKDALALLAVCIDQAVLDGGRFDLADLAGGPSFIHLQQQTADVSPGLVLSARLQTKGG